MKQHGRRSAACSQKGWDHLAYQSWAGQAFLSAEEERHRQTVCRLARALEQIIQEELSPSQRQLLERCWLEGEKPAQIARETGRSRSTVSRTLRRAQEVIDSRLKYAVLALEREKEESDYLQMVSPHGLHRGFQCVGGLRGLPWDDRRAGRQQISRAGYHEHGHLQRF